MSRLVHDSQTALLATVIGSAAIAVADVNSSPSVKSVATVESVADVNSFPSVQSVANADSVADVNSLASVKSVSTVDSFAV